MHLGGLTIERNEVDGERQLKFSGELDMATSDSARAALSEAQTGKAAIVVDTTGVTFVDSTGLAILIAARQRMGDRLTLIPGHTIRHLLELSGALEYFGLDS